MNYLVSFFPDSVMSASEPIAIFLWGIALVLLSRRPMVEKVAVAQPVATPQRPGDSPLIARIS